MQSSTRASFYLYTTPAEIDALIEGLDYTICFLREAAMKVEELYQEIILDHYRDQASQRTARAVRGRGAITSIPPVATRCGSGCTWSGTP